MKLKTLILHSVMAFMAVLTCFPMQAVNTINYTASYGGTLTFGTDTLDGVTYRTVHYDGLFNDGAPGMPSLPVDYIRFSVPWNATNFSVTSSLGNSTNYSNKYLVYPCQPPRMMSDTTPVAITPPDLTAYADYPQQNAWVVDEGFLAGENHIVTVAVMPISYKFSPLYGYYLKKHHQICITLNYDINSVLDVYPLICKKQSKRDEGYRLTQKLVINPEAVIDNAPTELTETQILQCYSVHSQMNNSNIIPPYLEDTIENPFHFYTIITPDSLKSSLKRLAAFKSQKGYKTNIETVESLINQYLLNNPSCNINDIDSAQVIRQFLINSFYNGEAGFVLMAGKDVPFKTGWFNTCQTDQYYCDLTSYWNSSFDYCPDVYVGRIIARGKEQICNYTDKLLRYELNPGKGDFSYLKRALYTNGYDMEYNGYSFTDIVRSYADSIYTNATVFTEDRINKTPSGTQIINEINNTQYGFINFNNHGLPMGIPVYGKGGEGYRQFYWIWAIEGEHAPDSVTSHANDDLSSGNGLNNMVNKYYPSICFSPGCDLMPFKIPSGYESATMLFGESFTTGKDYGGPAFLGNTRDNGFDMVTFGKDFFKLILKEFPKIGMAHAISKIYKFDSATKMIYNLLGDPEFEVWTDIPQLYSNITLTRTNNTVTVTGDFADSAIVAYYANDGQVGMDTISTSTSSVTLNGISPNSTIMLYKHNYIPYIAPLELQNITLANDQYVIAGDVTAGNAIDSIRTNGDVVVPDGVEYEIEASGKVTLKDGFRVEKGATFAVYPSSF